MNKLLVRDSKGIEREVTKKAFELVGHTYGYVIIGEVKGSSDGFTEVQKVMQELKEKKAADDKRKLVNQFVEDQQKPQPEDSSVSDEDIKEVIKKGKPGPKPKTK